MSWEVEQDALAEELLRLGHAKRDADLLELPELPPLRRTRTLRDPPAYSDADGRVALWWRGRWRVVQETRPLAAYL